MALSKHASFTCMMNKSLDTKITFYESMAEDMKQRPVIFTNRAEIWSDDTNPIILIADPFPFVSPSNNRIPGDITREMMEYCQKLLAAKKKVRHHFNLILFELKLPASNTEVHAIFTRRKSSPNEIPAEIYLKTRDPTGVITRQCSTELNPKKTIKTCGPTVSADEVWSDSARSGPPVLPRTSAMYRRYSSPGGAGAYQSVSSDSTRSRLPLPLMKVAPANCRCFWSPKKEDVPEEFFRSDVKFERNFTSLTSSFVAVSPDSVDEGADNEIMHNYRMFCEHLGEIIFRLGPHLTNDLDDKLRVYAHKSPDTKNSTFIFTNNCLMWKKYLDPIIKITNLPPIPPNYNHEKDDIIKDIANYMRQSHVLRKLPDWEPVNVVIIRYGTGADSQVHILLTHDPELMPQYYVHSVLPPTLNPPSSSAHSLPVAAPQTSAGLSDIPQDDGFPHNPE